MVVPKVRYHRIRNDYTIEELANKIGVTRQHLNSIELGRYPLTEKVAIKLAYVFDVKADELFGEKLV